MPFDSQYLWLTVHSISEMFPTIPSTLSVSTSFFASEATWPGSVCSVSTS